MVTLEQLQTLRYGANFHYTGPSGRRPSGAPCSKMVGPRGGETYHVVRVRASGALRTWKTRPGEFRLPVKHGLRESGAITHDNAGDFHLAGDCPVEELRGY